MEDSVVFDEMNGGSEELTPIEPEAENRKKFDRIKQMIEKIGKRNIIIASSVMLIAVAVILNFIMFGHSTPVVGEGELLGAGNHNMDSVQNVSDTPEVSSYFASAQLSRKQTRDQALAVLMSVVDSQSADKTAKEQASLDISRITTEMEAEPRMTAFLPGR